MGSFSVVLSRNGISGHKAGANLALGEIISFQCDFANLHSHKLYMNFPFSSSLPTLGFFFHCNKSGVYLVYHMVIFACS